MKIMICCSTNFYDKVDGVSKYLLNKGHEIIYPNGYREEDNTNYDSLNLDEFSKLFRGFYECSVKKIDDSDAILVLNYCKVKNGVEMPNYIGASTFLEMYNAFMTNKKIYMLNDLPDNMLRDEIRSFKPIILNGDINNFK